MEKLIPTKKFPYLKFKFKDFNPVQSEAFQYFDKDINCVVAASTSAGKTTIAEMFMAYSVENGKKAAFLSPLKAVSQQKYDDWINPSHGWSQKNISIVTGDYSLTEKRVEELKNTNIIIMTTEMMDSRTRRMQIEKNVWLNDIETLVVDEIQLLTTNRGDKCESALMRFTQQNPNCRIVLLSATMPNVEQLSGWLTLLNNKKTELIVSDYRPIDLSIHYERYSDRGSYYDKERNKVQKVIELVNNKLAKNEQILIFVHTKKTGYMLQDELKSRGIKCEFHRAELSLKDRLKIEEATMKKELNVLIATSTISWGINL